MYRFIDCVFPVSRSTCLGLNVALTAALTTSFQSDDYLGLTFPEITFHTYSGPFKGISRGSLNLLEPSGVSLRGNDHFISSLWKEETLPRPSSYEWNVTFL